MAYLKLLLSNALIITVALASSTYKYSKNISCTAISIDLPKSLKHDLTYKIDFFNIIPQIIISTQHIGKNNNTNKNINLLEGYDEETLAKIASYYCAYTIDVPINRQTKTICLHIENLKLLEPYTNLYLHRDNVFSIKKLSLKEKKILTPLTYLYNDKEKTVILDFGNKLLSLLDAHKLDFDICKLFLILSGNITNSQESNFFRTSYIDGIEKERHWLIAAGDFQAIGAQVVLSCWVESTIKWKRQIIITISHEKNYTVLSNVQKKYSTNRNSTHDITGITETKFHFTDEISPNHLTFIVSDLPLLSSKYGMNMWGRQFASLELKFAWDIVANVTFCSKEMWYNKCNKTGVLTISEKWYKKCDKIRTNINHVAIPGFRDEGMRSFGLDYYNEASIIYNKTLDTIACKIKVAQIVARKTILLLLGNMTSLSSWTYMWLNEGIATFMGMYIVDQIIPNFRMMDLFVVQIQHESFRLNSYYDVPLIVETNTTSDIKSPFSHYLKAPVFMRMLQHVMTNESFLLGLNLYLEQQLNLVKNVSSDISKLTFDNFWIAMTTSFETTHKSEFDLKNKFDNWMIQGHYPVVIVKRDYNEKDLNYVTIQLSQEKKSYFHKWRIPITYSTKTNSNFTKTTPAYWLESPISSLIVHLVSKTDWIIVNVQQAGYYRVNYDWKNWQLIADYLRFKDHTRIHVLNRAQIIDDSFHFLLKGQLRFYLFCDLTSYLFKETDYIAWYPMFKVSEQMSGLLPYNQSIYFKIHMSYILNRLLGKIGYEETPFENPLTVSLRQEAAKWACTFGSSTCKKMATKIMLKQFSENGLQNILPGWKHWTHCYGLMSVKKSVWLHLIQYYYLNFSPKIIEFLSCFKDFYTISTLLCALSIEMSGKNYPMTNDYINSFRSSIVKHARNNVVLDYLLVNMDEFVFCSKMSTTTYLIIIINHVYSKDQIDKIRDFINRFNTLRLKSYISMLHRKLEIRLSEINRQLQFLQKML